MSVSFYHFCVPVNKSRTPACEAGATRTGLYGVWPGAGIYHFPCGPP
jgi:hypothetical protein